MATKFDVLPPLDPLRRYPVELALSYLAVSRKTFYAIIADGRIATIKEGRRRYVPGAEIARLSRAPSASGAS